MQWVNLLLLSTSKYCAAVKPSFHKHGVRLSVKAVRLKHTAPLLKHKMSCLMPDSACIAISHLKAICLWTRSLTLSPLLFFFHLILVCFPHLSFTISPSPLSLYLTPPAFYCLASHFRHLTSLLLLPLHTASQSHLICSPLRLSNTQHPQRGWRERGADETCSSVWTHLSLSWKSANICAHESLNYYSMWECMWIPFSMCCI